MSDKVLNNHGAADSGAASSGAAVPGASATGAVSSPASPVIQNSAHNSAWVNWALGLCALAIAVLPIWLNFGDPNAEEAFGGTDGQAEEAIAEVAPDYEPWFEPLIGELPGEIESGLFAFQAALGSGVLCYVLGRYQGRRKAELAAAAAGSGPATPAAR